MLDGRQLVLLLATLVAADQDIPFGGGITVIQTSEWSHFRLIGLADAFNLATLQLQSNSRASAWPLFLLRRGVPPALDTGQLPVADISDMNAWATHKLSHYLSFTDSLWSAGDVTYISVYISAVDFAGWTYSLSVASSSSPLCPGNCLSRGQCIEGRCSCYSGFVDVDCSTTAVQLQEDYSKTVKATNSSFSFAYVKWTDGTPHTVSGRRATVSISWGVGTPILISKSGSPGYRTWMPTVEENDDFSIGTGMPVEFDIIKCSNCDYWYFAVSCMNDTLSSPMLTYWSLKTSGDSELNKLLIVLVSLSCGLVVFWACFAIYKWRRARPEPVDLNYRVQASNGLPQSMLEQSFPAQVYSAYLGTSRRAGDQDKCPICLEVWTPESEIRALPCEHIYHVKCIDSWFQGNTVLATQICCMCKRDYNELNATVEETNALYSESPEALSVVEPASRLALRRRAELPEEPPMEVQALSAENR